MHVFKHFEHIRIARFQTLRTYCDFTFSSLSAVATCPPTRPPKLQRRRKPQREGGSSLCGIAIAPTPPFLLHPWGSVPLVSHHESRRSSRVSMFCATDACTPGLIPSAAMTVMRQFAVVPGEAPIAPQKAPVIRHAAENHVRLADFMAAERDAEGRRVFRTLLKGERTKPYF